MTLRPDLQRDLVDAATRMSGPRFPARLRIATAFAAAAVIVAALLLVVREGSDQAPSRWTRPLRVPGTRPLPSACPRRRPRPT
jgi:hypothetical protein